MHKGRPVAVRNGSLQPDPVLRICSDDTFLELVGVDYFHCFGGFSVLGNITYSGFCLVVYYVAYMPHSDHQAEQMGRDSHAQ